jgi:hypothetical protein
VIRLDIKLDGDGAWPDMAGAPEAKLEAVSRLRFGVTSGRSSVGFRLRMPDGRLVFAQTTMRLFLTAADAFRAADEKDGVPK